MLLICQWSPENGHILDLMCINGDWDKSPGKCIKKPVCEANSYAACILPQVCHDTCDNYLSQNKFECDNSLPCEWGCKCNDGFVLNSENKCVHPDQCGCPDPNFVANPDTMDDSAGPNMYMPGVSILKEFCGQKCTCMGSKWECEDYQCPGGTFCSLDLDEKFACTTDPICPDTASWSQWISNGCKYDLRLIRKSHAELQATMMLITDVELQQLQTKSAQNNFVVDI